jgi:enoyl-CoA hydratase
MLMQRSLSARGEVDQVGTYSPMMMIMRGAARRGLSTYAPRSLREVTFAQGVHGGTLLERATSYEALAVSVDEASGIAEILLNRPAKKNAQNMAMWNELIDVFSAASVDSTIRVAILAGSGGHFCSGMDLSVFAEMKALAKEEKCEGRTREQLLRSIEFFQSGVNAPELCAKPVICAIEGNAIGGGVDLATACDLRYATDDAKISVKEVDLGIVADVGTMQRLPFLVGDQRARELTYTGRTIGGKDAAAYGLCLESFPTADAMMAHVRSVAATIASKSPLTVRGIKRTALYTRDHPTVDALNQVAHWNMATLLSDDLDEAFGAMMERREPTFRGD